MSEKMQELMGKVEEAAKQFPTEEALQAGLNRACDFLAGAAAMSCILEGKDARA